ncbi:MAG: hypothetical protein ISS02_01315 [Candidatus Portnoybacteria bacterium]|nr:hypothetical protein [Candidatus Portnoybacteria bacterium]
MKNKIIIMAIVVLSGLVFPRAIFALANPIEDDYWENDFNSWRSIDDNKTSNIEMTNSIVSLMQDDAGLYSYSGVLWTKRISFSKDIHSLSLNGLYYAPPETNIIVSVVFYDDIKEYQLDWSSRIEPEEAHRKFYLKILLATNDRRFTPELDNLTINVKLQDRSDRGISNRDKERVYDLKRIKSIVSKYHDDFKAYPVVDIDHGKKKDQWRILKNILDSVSDKWNKRYNWGFMTQPEGVDNDYKYGYLTASTGSSYLLWTKLEDNDSKYLEDSWQGDLFEIDCSEKIYCIYSDITSSIPNSVRHFDKGEDIQINELKFIKTENNSKVYFQTQGHRFWLRTPEIFAKAGGSWQDIFIISNEQMNSIPLFKFIKKADKSTVYLINSAGFKRKMFTPAMFHLYGDFSEVVTVEDGVIDLIPYNYLIRKKNGIKVYFLSDKIKRWIFSKNVFDRINLDFSDVEVVDKKELDYYFEANPIF